MTTKTCTKCKTEKPLTDFRKNNQQKDGVHCYCKTCVNTAGAAHRKANPGQRKAYYAEWYTDNTEKIKEATAKWQSDNPDKVRGYNAKWRGENPDKVKASKAEYRSDPSNREKEKATSAIYRAIPANRAKEKATRAKYRADPANVEKMKASEAKRYAENPAKAKELKRIRTHNRRARKLESGGNLSRGLAFKLFALQKGKCTCCGKPLGTDFHLDHIMPLALGGANEDLNVQLLHSFCNQHKHAKHPVDFMQERGFLI